MTLKKVGISPAQCALGFRVATVMLNSGVKEDSFETFISDVYNRCKEIGLSPENISSFLQDLLHFSKDFLPLSKLQDFIKQKAAEKLEWEQEIEELKDETEVLLKEKSNAESLRDKALNQATVTTSEIKWYSDFRKELRRYEIPVHETSKFAKLIDNLRTYNYDVEKVIKEFSDLEFLQWNYDYLQQASQSLQNKFDNLQQQHSTLEALVNMHTQALSKYNQLENMGFGLKKLQFLWTTVNEIAFENNLPVQNAVEKFLSDIEQQ